MSMEPAVSAYIQIKADIERALSLGRPVVALESTVITHGLPFPDNLTLAEDMEREVRQQGAVPATIAVLEGLIQIGLSPVQLERLATGQNLHKISTRDFARVIARRESGGTTVAGTLVAAHAAGIKVFATGGIGGVHRRSTWDISTDLLQLAHTPLIVVCAGAKAVLDLPATLEYLETHAVMVLGYQTDTFPAFYSSSSKLPVEVRVDSPGEVALQASIHWELGLKSAILVAVPPPEDVALPEEQVLGAIEQALGEVQEKGLRGQSVTPFLLKRVSELTHGASLKANLGLLKNNAKVAAQIALQIR